MEFFHMNCRIVGKSKGKSSVAAAAYISAGIIWNERTGLTHDFRKKRDVIFPDTVLCDNAPSIYKDRSVLWNAVEKIEKSSDARFARQFDLAIPNEFSGEQAKELFYAVAHIFTEQGMCFDGGIHWEEGNHHFDFLVTTRPFQEDGTWGTKEKKDFAFKRDEAGKRIIDRSDPYWWEDKKNPDRCGIRIPELGKNGEQKRDKKGGKIWKREHIDSTGWDGKEMVEHWREACCQTINAKAIEYGFSFQIDHRSYKKQKKDIVPEIHEGYMARKMEQAGLVADRCQINRDIRQYNSALQQIKELAGKITNQMIGKAREILGRFKNLKGSIGTVGKARGDDGHSGTSAGRNRESENASGRSRELKSDIEQTMERAGSLERGAEQTERQIAGTDCFIERAGEQIEELAGIIEQRRRERDERIKKLIERRKRSASRTAGADAGRNRKEGYLDSGLAETEEEIRKFLSDVDAEEQSWGAVRRNSEIKRDGRISERMDRESERKRLDCERERAAKAKEQKAGERKAGHKTRSRERDSGL